MGAQHLNQRKDPPLLAFDAMGKPISYKARQKGYEDCKAMGLMSSEAYGCVAAVCEQLERDRPFEALAAAMKYIDLTGSYRLFAVVLVAATEE